MPSLADLSLPFQADVVGVACVLFFRILVCDPFLSSPRLEALDDVISTCMRNKSN